MSLMFNFKDSCTFTFFFGVYYATNAKYDDIVLATINDKHC